MKVIAETHYAKLLATGRWFSLGTPVSSTNKTDHHDITEILLKVVLSTIIEPQLNLMSTFLLFLLVFF